MKAIKIKNEIKIKDYRSLVYFNSVMRKKSTKYTLSIMSTFCVLCVIYSLINYGNLNVLAGFASMYLLFILMSMVMLEFNIKKFAKEKDSLINKEQNITIRDNGIKVCNYLKPEGENYGWNAISKVYETKKYFFVYTSIGQILITPKSEMSVEELQNLKKLLKLKIADKYIEF